MIEYQLASRGLRDQTILNAVNAVPREEFVPTCLLEFAYNHTTLPIAARQTISQRYLVALRTAALELRAEVNVLEVAPIQDLQLQFWQKLPGRWTTLRHTARDP